MSQHNAKRPRLGSNGLNDGAETAGAHDGVIARLLQDGTTADLKKSAGQTSPIIRDDSARPSFQVPDLTASSSLLARVQNFLPQLQQANSALSTSALEDHGETGGFELVPQDSDEEEEEGSSTSSTTSGSSTSSDSSDEEGGTSSGADVDDAAVGSGIAPFDRRQIVMNLALGVLEHQYISTGSSRQGGSDDPPSVGSEPASVAASMKANVFSRNSKEELAFSSDGAEESVARPRETGTDAMEAARAGQPQSKDIHRKRVLIEELP